MKHPYIRRTVAAGLSTVLLAAAAPAGAAPIPDAQRADSARRGAQYIAGLADATSSNITGQLATALPAGGLHAADVRGPGASRSVADAILAGWASTPVPATASAVGVQLTVARGIGADPRRIPRPGAPAGEPVNRSLVADAAAIFASGQFQGDLIGTMFTLIGLSETDVTAAPQPWLDTIADYLASAQQPRTGFPDQGGWGFSKPPAIPPPAVANPGVDTTGTALAALCRAGRPPTDWAVARALNYLDAVQNQANGGFGNVNSTASVVIGLKSCGIDVQGERWTVPSGENPISRLIALQRADGAWPYPDTGTGPNALATQDAVRAVAPGRTGYATPRPLRSDPDAPAEGPVATAEPGQRSWNTVVIDFGAGPERIRTCAVPVVVGADAEAVLAAAAAESRPGGCVRSARFAGTGADRRLTALDGVGESAGEDRGWTFRVDGGPATSSTARAVTATGSVLFARYEGTVVPDSAPSPAPEQVAIVRVPVERVVERVVERLVPGPSGSPPVAAARIRISGVRTMGAGHRRRLEIGGTASGPSGAALRIRIARRDGTRCRPLTRRGGFGAARSCARVPAHRIAGTGLWSIRVPLSARGRSRLLVQAAVEVAGVTRATARRTATVRGRSCPDC